MPSKAALREPAERDIRRAALALCRETCAHNGAPPCFEVCRDLRETWPPATCNEPGCIVLATIALIAFLNPSYTP